MHVPVETARAAREHAASVGADACVAVGGGSTIGLGKAIALEFGLPIIAVPTTYAGSEMTPVYGMRDPDQGVKHVRRDPSALPKVAIYDPELFLDFPADLTASTAMNSRTVQKKVPQPGDTAIASAHGTTAVSGPPI